jgi:hypothetical protein
MPEVLKPHAARGKDEKKTGKKNTNHQQRIGASVGRDIPRVRMGLKKVYGTEQNNNHGRPQRTFQRLHLKHRDFVTVHHFISSIRVNRFTWGIIK